MNFLANLARKILFFPLTRMIIAILMILIPVVLESLLRQELGARYRWRGQPWLEVVWAAILIATALVVYRVYVRVFERRAVTELAVRPAWREFAAGAALGFGLFTATIACLWILGYYRVEGFGRIPSAVMLVGMGLVPAFGVAVSGIKVNGLLRSTLTGPELFSGGAFGAEASIVAVLVCTSMAVVLIVRGARNGQLVRPFWARRKIEAAAAPEINGVLNDPVLA